MKKNQTMTVIAAYLAVILIWSTTPLAIKWSSEGVGYLFGISGRMLIGTVLAVMLTLFRYGHLPMHRTARKAYLASSLAIFGAMMPVYWGAQFISSGLISVIFGLTPIVTGWLAARLLFEKSVTSMKIAGALLGVTGLSVIFYEQISLGDYAIWGISAVLLSVILHSISSVWIKRINADLPALVITSGGLLFSLPLFGLVYVLFASPLPAELPDRAIWSVIYLGVMGSVVGFVSFYYVLSNLNASTVALVTLLTPVTALWLGYIFNNEAMSLYIWLGTLCVLMGLVLHQWGGFLSKYLWPRFSVSSD